MYSVSFYQSTFKKITSAYYFKLDCLQKEKRLGDDVNPPRIKKDNNLKETWNKAMSFKIHFSPVQSFNFLMEYEKKAPSLNFSILLSPIKTGPI